MAAGPANAEDDLSGLFVSSPPDDELGLGSSVVSDRELAINNGGTEIDIGDIGLNIASNKATLSNNSVEGTVTTGTISENTLNDVSGINSLMYNTGNNVNFQSNMQINIFLK
jgi:hypothetical protein